ncbi:hypothetical protein AB0J08_16765, partial [Kitasatospora sp. NPDC050463]
QQPRLPQSSRLRERPGGLTTTPRVSVKAEQAQLALLTRIGEGVNPVTSDEPTLAVTARALKGRGLVLMPKAADKKWRAEITDVGRFYLEHGHHPDQPAKKVGRPAERGQVQEPATKVVRQDAQPSEGAASLFSSG